MTKTNKETVIISAIAASIGGLIVSLIMFSFTTRYDKDGLIDQKLDQKVDKVEFADKYKEVNMKIDTKVDKEVFEMSQKNIDIFIKNQIQIQEDIKEMLKNK